MPKSDGVDDWLGLSVINPTIVDPEESVAVVVTIVKPDSEVPVLERVVSSEVDELDRLTLLESVVVEAVLTTGKEEFEVVSVSPEFALLEVETEFDVDTVVLFANPEVDAELEAELAVVFVDSEITLTEVDTELEADSVALFVEFELTLVGLEAATEAE